MQCTYYAHTHRFTSKYDSGHTNDGMLHILLLLLLLHMISLYYIDNRMMIYF